MDTTVNIIRNRVDSAGVSGANVNSQGGNVVVQFPGVKDPETLIKLIGTDGPALLQTGAVRGAALQPARQRQVPAVGSAPIVRQYATTAANLTVNTSNSSARATTSPPTLPSRPYPSSTNDDPNAVRAARAPILLRGHSSTLASSWPNRHSTAVRSPRHRRCSIPS